MTATAARLTLEEFLGMPETEPESEFYCGEVIQKPMPDQARSALQTYLAVLLFGFLRANPIGRVATEWRCIFGTPGHEATFVPDLVYVSNERLAHGDARAHRFLRTAPDLAIEVLSPGQPAGPFTAKILFYLRHGVRLVWVIDPERENVMVLAPDANERTLVAGDTLDGGDVLPGFSVPVADIFAQLQV